MGGIIDDTRTAHNMEYRLIDIACTDRFEIHIKLDWRHKGRWDREDMHRKRHEGCSTYTLSEVSANKVICALCIISAADHVRLVLTSTF